MRAFVRAHRTTGLVVVALTALLTGCSSAATPAPRQAAPLNQVAPTAAPATAGNGAARQPGPAAPGDAGTGLLAPGPAATPAPAAPQVPAAGATAPGVQPEHQRDDRPAPTPSDVTFREPGLNPWVDTARDHLSTFGLDVDTASYTVARSWIEAGNLPDPASVRVEEWLNFFDQGYAPPETGAFAIYATGAPAPFLTGSHSDAETLLRVGIKARSVSRHERPNAALTFVIDTSGSMAEGNRLELVKSSLRLLVDQLRPSDRVAIVAFSTDARVVLRPTPGDQRGRILGAIDELVPQQTTNAEAGLRLGYGLARESMIEGGINRVVLASDGVANVGDTDSGAILDDIQRDAAAGIQLVAVGVGMGNYNDALLEQLADNGDGFYAYIDSQDEAHRLFVERLVSTLDTVALDAKAQVDFDPDVVAEYRLIGYENRAIADRDFRNDRVAAGAIGAGHSVTVLYAVRLREGFSPEGRLATVSLRWTDPATKGAVEMAQDVRGPALARSWGQADEHLRLDALVAAAAETFRGSPWIEDFSIRQLADAAREVRGDLPRTAQVDELLRLLEDAARLAR